MQIHRIPRPTSQDAKPHPLTQGLVTVERAMLLASRGHDDFADSARARTVRLFGSATGISLAWVALPDGVAPDDARPEDALAFVNLGIPLREDLNQAHVMVVTHPAHRSRGHAKALLDAVRPVLAEHGRTVWTTSTDHPGPAFTGPGALLAKSGSGSVDRAQPHSRWAAAEGFELEQCERPSTLTLTPEALTRAAALGEAAAGRAAEYELVSWVGPAPDEIVEGVARVVGKMSTDAPSAGLEYEEQVWDTGRLRAAEERGIAAGHAWASTVALHRPTGEVVAFTEVDWPQESPAGVWQDDTIVRADHRGHRLGLRIKAANLANLAAANPRARRVHTWNADENGYMLGINDALGFVPTGLEGLWQRKA